MLPEEFIMDSPDQLVSADTVKFLELVGDLGLGLMLVVIGLVSNCFNIRVFLNQGFVKIPVNVTLFALAVSDFAVLLSALVYKSSFLLSAVLSESEFHFWFHNVMFYFAVIKLGVSRIAFSMTALLSVERWVAVIFPLRAKRWLTVTKLAFSTILLVVLITALVCPIGIFLKGDHEIDPGLYSNTISNQSDEILLALIVSSTGYDDIIVTYLLYCTLIIIPSVCILNVVVSTISIIVKLKQGRARRHTTDLVCARPEMSHREARIAKALVTIMIIFVVCEAPMNIWAYVQLWVAREQYNLHLLLFLMCIILETLNSSVNFFVYFTFYPSFKETFRNLYPCIRFCDNTYFISWCRSFSDRFSRSCCFITKERTPTQTNTSPSQEAIVIPDSESSGRFEHQDNGGMMNRI